MSPVLRDVLARHAQDRSTRPETRPTTGGTPSVILAFACLAVGCGKLADAEKKMVKLHSVDCKPRQLVGAQRLDVSFEYSSEDDARLRVTAADDCRPTETSFPVDGEKSRVGHVELIFENGPAVSQSCRLGFHLEAYGGRRSESRLCLVDRIAEGGG
jgi:hypothetical protein